jgi:hypothetical protein
MNSLRSHSLRQPLPLIRCALLIASAAIPLAAQTPDTSGFVSIRLEQLQGQVTRAVPQNTVFHAGDILRFRLSSHLAGYLYVVDKGTTGSITTLFPASGKSEGNNRIEPNQSYLVPANGDGWFSVSGPPGFDVLYFLVSDTPINLPQSIGGPAAQPQPNEAPPPGMLPRCDDEIFKARGDCLDDSAGVAPLAPGTPIPRELTPLGQTASRDIILTDDGDNTVVKPAAAAKLPMIYTFRLAHRE